MLKPESHIQEKLNIYQKSAVTDVLPLKVAVLQTVYYRVFLQGLIKGIHWNKKNNPIEIIEVGTQVMLLSSDQGFRKHKVKRQDETYKCP